MTNLSCQNCRYWNRLSEASGECRRRSPALGAVGELARWPGTEPAMWCWEWRPTKEVRVPKLSGRPKIHSVEAVMEALGSMTPDDAPRAFKDLLALINVQLPMSKSVAYRFVSELSENGFLEKRDGGWVRATASKPDVPELD